jgi:type VI secretion system lysozyme-like protein
VAPAPLFDRLVDLEPWTSREVHPESTLDAEALRESVRRELECLLGTRCTLTLEEAETRDPGERSVLDYGLPDLGPLDPVAPADQERLAGLLSRTITAFEPRLRQVRVSVRSHPEDRRVAVATLTALLVVESLAEQISFPLRVELGPSEAGEGVHGR